MNSIFVPKSIDHPNINDDEIKAFYSLHPVNASNEDYDFTKQFDGMLAEYMELQTFKTPNAKRCFKKQLKKMILVDKPKNSKKYSHFLSWRLKQINLHKSKQRDIENTDLLEKYNKLLQENNELKEKLKKYESESVIDPVKEKEVPYEDREIDSDSDDSDDEDFSSDEEEEIEDPVEPKQKLQQVIDNMKSPPVKPPTEPLVDFSIDSKHITEEEYKAMETDEKRVEIYWVKIDECIEQIEKFFISTCNRDKEKIVKLVDIFDEWFQEEFSNIDEAIEYDDVNMDRLETRPYDILRYNLSHEAK